MQIGHYLPRTLPDSLRELTTLALDLRWSWHHGADTLWQAVDSGLWEATANPWLILETVSDQRLEELASDAQFLQNLQAQLDAHAEHYQGQAWFTGQYGSQFSGQIAYFSMEFGLSESLPIYSGGLGVLAGDFLKTACDLDVPVVGIGLLYQQGYFRQSIDASGEQLEFYPFNDPTMLPIVPLRDDEGEWIRISLELPGRTLRLRTWLAQVGRRSLLLLDSNDLLNDPGDRGITSELYGGGTEMRLQQEIVLGIGGWRLLERLGLDCPVCHLNEGHAAFAILERARQYMQRTQQPFAVALCATRAGNLFTTHTPVAAGFDVFPADMLSLYFRDYVGQLGISMDELLALGRANEDPQPFNMAYLAVHGAGAVNGVSHLHGEVSRGILQPLFPHWPHHEVPVGHVTNGVHVPSWDSTAADTLWTEACGKSRWLGALDEVEASIRQLPDDKLWEFRARGRRNLIKYLQQRLLRQRRGRGNHVNTHTTALIEQFDPDTLTLGFARRFAEYKRTNLLLNDQERLLRLLGDRDRPVQLVIAGKAHPHDVPGKQLLHEWQAFIQRPEVRGRVVFVEDYDLDVAAQLIQGVDVWINTPRRPWEASGTSGMKVLVNGGINLSELDGWWAEAYEPDLGWALGDSLEHDDSAYWDHRESEQLYQLLENEVMPCFYRRDERGLPRQWIERMRESMARLTTQYSSNRMLREYVENYYLPLAIAFHRRTPDTAREIEKWQQTLACHWQHLHFGNVNVTPVEGGHQFEVQVYLDELPAESIAVELYADPSPQDNRPYRQVLTQGSLLSGTVNAYIYQGTAPADRPARDYTPRIVPAHPEANTPLEANFILWY